MLEKTQQQRKTILLTIEGNTEEILVLNSSHFPNMEIPHVSDIFPLRSVVTLPVDVFVDAKKGTPTTAETVAAEGVYMVVEIFWGIEIIPLHIKIEKILEHLRYPIDCRLHLKKISELKPGKDAVHATVVFAPYFLK